MSLTADRNTPKRSGRQFAFPVGSGKTIFAGSLVALNATGYLVPGAEAVGLVYMGRAEERVDNSSGGDGARTALVDVGNVFQWKNSATDPVTVRGSTAYIEDDATVSATSNEDARSPAGLVLAIDTDGVWIARS